MQDSPKPAVLLAAAIRHFRSTGDATASKTFMNRVAINALDVVRRELELAPASDALEHARLRGLLEVDGSLADLNERLCQHIKARKFADLNGITDHLWQTTLEKLSVDQPNYATYKLVSKTS